MLAYLVGLALAAIGLASLTTIPAWPVLGVAIAAAAMLVNTAATRLSEATCLGCGASTAELPKGEHGTICPHCGTIGHTPDDSAHA